MLISLGILGSGTTIRHAKVDDRLVADEETIARDH
jgi:hypothetical protein